MCVCIYLYVKEMSVEKSETAFLHVQLRAKPEEENLAEWLVDITSEAERQGSDKFVTGYAG